MSSSKDEAVARYATEHLLASPQHLEQARIAQLNAAADGHPISLAEALVAIKIIRPEQRDEMLRELQIKGVQQLGHYKLLKKLGEGGMGSVYLAEDTVGERKVALKVLQRKLATNAEAFSRFQRETKATGKLNHPNIVSAYDAGEDRGHHYYVMEYCDGDTLDKIIKREKRLAVAKGLELMAQIARGLKHAHQHGIVHRDIKPANIFVTSDGLAKILDLGLSKNVFDSELEFNTQAGVALGTPHYISPEQARGDKIVDGRSDIYSLGAAFYHALTGSTPFSGASGTIIMFKHLTDEPVRPRELNPEIPEGVSQIILKSMAKNVEDRYAGCDVLITDLELALAGQPPKHAAGYKPKPGGVAQKPTQPPPAAAAPAEPKSAQAVTARRVPSAERKEVHLRKKKKSDPTVLYIAIIALIGALVVLAVVVLGEKKQPAAPKPPAEARGGAGSGVVSDPTKR